MTEPSQAPSSDSTAAAFAVACASSLQACKDGLARLETLSGPRSVDGVLVPLNALLMELDAASSRAGLYRDVHPDAAVRALADRAEQDLQQVATALHLSRPVFEAVRTLEVSTADAATRRFVTHLVRDFRRAGVDRDEPTRIRVRELKDELVQLGQAFGRNIREDVRGIDLASAELEGLPADWIAGHVRAADGRVRVTTDYPDYVPFMTYATSDARRRELYVAYRQRGFPANLEVLGTLVARRHELASALGYDSWAAYVTEDKMMRSPERAHDFVERVASLARPRAARDYDVLLARLRELEPAAVAVGDWQKTWLEELVRRERYALDSQEVRRYFAYDDVERGVLATAGRLFGLELRRIEAPVWHPSVKAFEVRDAAPAGDGELVGRFYLDMHPREGKYKHAAMFPVQAGVLGMRLPEAALVCNFPGGDGTRGLLEHGEVETFFHEFGHLLHHLLGGRQRWVAQSGIATEWDFVEAPSQMLEEWAWDAATLRTFARDEQGEPLPVELASRLRRSRDLGKGLWVTQQMFYAALSLRLYRADPAGLDTTALVRELQGRYSPFAYVPDTYMWSLVIAQELFSAFEAEGLASQEVAARYRRAVLEPGGTRDAAELVRDFLGRDFGFDAFTGWLEAA
jgi:thimet oligopeptidase